MSHCHSTIINVEEKLSGLLDQVANTGIPVTVKRKGKLIMISCAENGSKLDRLEKHPNFLKGNPDDLVHMDWSDQWSPIS